MWVSSYSKAHLHQEYKTLMSCLASMITSEPIVLVSMEGTYVLLSSVSRSA